MPKEQAPAEEEHEDVEKELGLEFGPDTDTHQVQRLDEANQKAAETAAAKVAEEDDEVADAELTESAAEVQEEALSDSNPPQPEDGKGH